MPNGEQTVPVDLMIERLEEANARARERAAPAGEQASESERQVAAPHPSDEQKPPAVANRGPPRGWLALGLFGPLLAATIGVVAFVWQPFYFDAARMIVARWALPPVQTTPQVIAPIAAPMSPELAQRLETMARDLANVTQGIEQLKTSQEQVARVNAAVAERLKEALSKMTRDNAAAAEQVKAALSEITRDSAAIAVQLKASQEQAVRPRRRPVRILPQVEPQPETLLRRRPV
jgi:hypothetical protein